MVRVKKSAEMTPKMRRFVAEYLVDYNGTRAAQVAGYATPTVRAAKLLKHPLIAKAIAKINKEDQTALKLDRDEVLKQLCCCATRDGRQLFDKNGILALNHRVVGGKVEGTTVHDLPPQITNAIDGVKQRVKRYTMQEVLYEEVETELRLSGKIEAVNLAMKHFGMFAPDKGVMKVALDWDALYGREDMPDLAEEAIKRVKGGA